MFWGHIWSDVLIDLICLLCDDIYTPLLCEDPIMLLKLVLAVNAWTVTDCIDTNMSNKPRTPPVNIPLLLFMMFTGSALAKINMSVSSNASASCKPSATPSILLRLLQYFTSSYLWDEVYTNWTTCIEKTPLAKYEILWVLLWLMNFFNIPVF